MYIKKIKTGDLGKNICKVIADESIYSSLNLTSVFCVVPFLKTPKRELINMFDWVNLSFKKCVYSRA